MSVAHWPAGTLVPAMDALLAHLAGRERRPSATADPEYKVCIARAFDAGFVATSISLTLADLRALVRSRAPCVIRNAEGAIFAIVEGSRRTVRLLASDCTVRDARPEDVVRALASGPRERAVRLIEQIGAPLAGARPRRLEAALEEELAQGMTVARGLALRQHHAESTQRTLASIRSARHLATLFGISLVQSLLGMGGWAVLGLLALRGHADVGGLWGWALLSLSASFILVLATQYVGRFTLRASSRLRMRLLEGALSLEGDELSAHGMGGLMVMSTQADRILGAVIAFALSCLAALANVIATLTILSAAPLAALTIGTFLSVLLVACALAPRILRDHTQQHAERVRLTTELVERMLGHRTRLVQQTPESWHEGEDDSLALYGERARAFDRWPVHLRLVPRAYFLLSLFAVFLVLVASPTEPALALVLGGISLGAATLTGLAELLLGGAELFSQWKSIAPVTREGRRRRVLSRRELPQAEPDVLLELRGVNFGYPRRKPVFENARVVIRRGERVLIEGPSGGGKTTMAALLTGLVRPDAGLVLVKGIDHHSIGETELRRAVASAPQFYENHIFSGYFILNLLLGRQWPPNPNDLKDAFEVCKDLGLGPLLDKMPGGMFQIVGDMGWQLSHGEKSRVYLARTILQGSDVAVLDETFGALDPDTLRLCMAATMKRCKTLVVITHR